MEDTITTTTVSLEAPSLHRVSVSPDVTVSRALNKEYPETPEDVDFVDVILAREMLKMTMAEEEGVIFDIHGLASTDDPDDKPLPEYFAMLDEAVGKISNKKSYEKAVTMNPDFVLNKGFQLMFLRANRFDVTKSAQMLVRHFEQKENLFGDGEVLGRDVMLSDLDKEATEQLETGFCQVLPYRDVAGRPIVLFAPKLRLQKTPKINMQVIFYIFTHHLKDEETQKKGFVAVVHLVGWKGAKRSRMKEMAKIGKVIPQKIMGIHSCYDDAYLRPLLAAHKLYLMNKAGRARYRQHYGDQKEEIFQLQTYGIPVDEQLLHPNGSVSLEWHREWLQIRKSQEEVADVSSEALATEESPSLAQDVVVPCRFDVLFGRKKQIKQHTGNLRCQHLVDMNQEEYEAAAKFAKTDMAEKIVSNIHESGGRFLKWEESTGWQEVDRDMAREKISHWFRHKRSKTRSGNDGNQTFCSPSGSLRVTLQSQQHVKRVRSNDYECRREQYRGCRRSSQSCR